MRIVIDARWIFPEISGIGLYTQELIRALLRAGSPHEFVLLFGSGLVRERTLGGQGSGFSTQLLNYGLFSPANQIKLPALLRRLKADVYHSTNYMMPLLSGGGARRVVTIHDLIPLLFRDHAPRSKKARLFPIYRRLMFEVARRADRVIAVSQSTRRDLIEHLACAPEKIDVTLEGVRPEFQPAPRRAGEPPYVLYVGRRDPYKNLPLLVEAFADVAAQVPDARLRIIGPPDARYPEAPARAAALGLSDRIDWVGYAAPEQLVANYQQAAAFVLPSQYEGFGLTVLEAMACGAPVVCSNVSSLPEVVGDAALLVKPGDRSGLAGALTSVLSQPTLADDLRLRGLTRARAFTWGQAARATLRAYERAGSP